MHKENTQLTVAILSDPHFYHTSEKSDGESPSYLHVTTPQGPIFRRQDNPWASLLQLLENEGLSSDVLICPGDITTYAEPTALKVAWSCLISLGKKLGSRITVSATGNHDVSSRPRDTSDNVVRSLNNAIDLFENLKQLSPEYPVYIESLPETLAHGNRVHYFGADFVVIDSDPRFRLVVFNSCARHTSTSAEYERGRIADSALNWLDKTLSSLDESKVKLNLFVCHHHPIQHEDHHLGSYDFMQNGQRLLDLLSRYGDWIVFHGHKHHGKLTYALGGASSPVVFAASSFSAMLDDAALRMRNQFYLLDLVLPSTGGAPLGTVRAWNWYPGAGWRNADSPKDGIHTGCGFGERRHADILAGLIDKNLHSTMRWNDILLAIPSLMNVTPRDMAGVERSLRTRHNIQITVGPDGKFDEIARKKS